jgi:hypothetical protein
VQVISTDGDDGKGISRGAAAPAVALVPWSELLDAMVKRICDVDVT